MEKFDFVEVNNQIGKVFLPAEIMRYWNEEFDEHLDKTFSILKQLEIEPILAWGLAVNEIYNSMDDIISKLQYSESPELFI